MSIEPLQAAHPKPTADLAPYDDPLWYKDAVIYELHIKAFFDADGDGIGDFAGLIAKLDYVRDLGVNTIWLLPFYPSPMRDDGYDVADFQSVHPAYGSVADVRRLVDEAHRRGLRVITELVLNHTSDQHPWFQAARRAPRGSPERDFYVWSDDPARYAGTRIIFTDAETSNWTWDAVAGQYFWHRFFSHQPDLNFDNPAVRQAVFAVMAFWLETGVDGFRLDAIPYLVEREGTSNENLRETHDVIKELRRRLDASYANKLLLAEANMWPEDVREYFGDSDECHMAYHFPLMPRMYMAIAQEDRHPVVEILQQTPDIPPACQWAVFLRNHDELTLEMVTHRERDYMYSTYATDPRARLNLGIRRRLAPLLNNDRDRIKLMNSLLLSMPGSPVLYYGDEIGMGDNIFLGDRDGVRTPMQWSGDRNGGFSRADPQRLVLPPIQDSVYGFEAVNVERQSRDISSLLNWTRRMLAVRRSTQVFGRGRITLLHPGNRKILAYTRELGDEVVLCVANISRSAQPVEIDLARFKGRVPVEMLGTVSFRPIDEMPYVLSLPPHGFYWFRLSADAAPPDWYTDRRPIEDLATLVLFDGWTSLFRDRVVPWRMALATKTMAQFETELLPRFLARQRWFTGADGAPVRARLADDAILARGGREWLLSLIDAPPAASQGPAKAASDAEGPVRWFVPLALAWEDDEGGASDEGDERRRLLAPVALAKVRTQARVGVMADALADESFCQAVVQAIGESVELRAAHGTLRFVPTRAFAAVAQAGSELPAGLRLLKSSRGTSLLLGERLFLKVPRRVQAGIDCEVEMGGFLGEVAGFDHAAMLAGYVEHVAADGRRSVLLILQSAIPHQGDGWAFVVDRLAHQLDLAPAADAPASLASAASSASPPSPPSQTSFSPLPDATLAARVRTMAQRIAALHVALARPSGNPAFDPEAVSAPDLRLWTQQTRTLLAATLARLRDSAALLAPELRAAAERLAAAAPGIETRIAAAAALALPAGPKTRIHGALRLSELLLVHDDVFVIDFEGDAALAPADRRAKQSPLRDVAAMLRSFAATRFAALDLGAHSAAEIERREPAARAWVVHLQGDFLQAYADAAVAGGLFAGPEAFAALRPLLALFEIDQMLRPLLDELRLRPEAVAPLLITAAAWAAS